MMRFLLFALLAWFLYKLVFGFIIPVYKTTRIMKKKFREMHDHAREQESKQQAFNQAAAAQKTAARPVGGDYIDFEDIK